MRLALLLCGALSALVVLADSRPLHGGGDPGPAPRVSPPVSAEGGRRSLRLRWLAELGAENLPASARPAAPATSPVVISVPGAVYVFTLGPDGSLQKHRRLSGDEAAPYGVAVTDSGLALAGKEGSVGLWSVQQSGEVSLRWRRELGERASSVAWAGGDAIFVATWRNHLLGLSAADGRTLWTVDVGGRAEAPAVVEGNDVFVVTRGKSLFRIDATTGAVRWKVALPGLAQHPPVLLGEKPRVVICATTDGQLLAHDPLTGRVRWSATLPGKLASALLAGSESVAAITADGAAYTYAPSGEARWTQPGSSEGPAALLLSTSSGPPRVLAVSKMLVGLDLEKGTRVADYPRAAVEELKRRFADAMLEGVKTYTEGEKQALMAQEAFDISGPPFGPARLVGSQLAFGTEDGWAYLFDAATLRPRGRYRAGQPCSGLPVLAGGRVLAVAGEEMFGLDPSTGQMLWKRVVGGDAGPITGEAPVGVVAGGRVQALSPADGVLQWSARGRFRSLSPPAAGGEAKNTPWLVDDGEGNLRLLWPSGVIGSEALPAEGDLLPLPPAPGRSWVAATRGGNLFAVSYEPGLAGAGGTAPGGGRLVKSWEKSVGDHLLEIRVAGRHTVVRTESGSLVGFDANGQEGWRIKLGGEDRCELLPQIASFLILGTTDLRMHDWVSGEARFQWKVDSPALGADIRGRFLLWLDRGGSAYRVDLQEGRLLESAALGVPLASATPTDRGFLVTTAAGEVGLVEVGDAQPSPAAGGGQTTLKRGEGQ